DQVESGLPRLLERVGHRKNPQGLSGLADHADFLPPDLFVDANALLIDSSPPRRPPSLVVQPPRGRPPRNLRPASFPRPRRGVDAPRRLPTPPPSPRRRASPGSSAAPRAGSGRPASHSCRRARPGARPPTARPPPPAPP